MRPDIWETHTASTRRTEHLFQLWKLQSSEVSSKVHILVHIHLKANPIKSNRIKKKYQSEITSYTSASSSIRTPRPGQDSYLQKLIWSHSHKHSKQKLNNLNVTHHRSLGYHCIMSVFFFLLLVWGIDFIVSEWFECALSHASMCFSVTNRQ